MKRLGHKLLFIIGGILVLIGVIIPFLMVLDILPKALWLLLIIAICQMFGLFAGIAGSAFYVHEKRSIDKDNHHS